MSEQVFAERRGERVPPTLFFSLPEAVAIHELVTDAAGRARDYRVLDCNPAFSRLTGLSRERAIGRLASELYARGDAPHLAEFAQVVGTGEPMACETEWGPLAKHCRIAAVRSGPGQFALLAIDLTAYRRAASEAGEEARKLRECIELLPEVVFEADLHGRLTFANRQAFTLFGYTPEEFDRGLYVLETLCPADRDRARANIARVLQGERVMGHEYQALRKDGGTFPVLIYPERILREGQPAGMRGILVNISERKQWEERLAESEERYRLLVEAAPDGIVVHDGARYIYLNPAAARLHGVSDPAALVGQPLCDCLRPAAGPPAPAGRPEAPGPPRVGSLVRGDGTRIEVEVSGAACQYRGAGAVQAVVRDVTARLDAQAQLRRYADRLEIQGKIGRAILAARSPDEIARTALTHVRRLMPCRCASVVLFDQASPTAHVVAVDADGSTSLARGRTISLEALPEALQQGRIYHCENPGGLPAVLAAALALGHEGRHALHCAPLKVGDAVLGALCVGVAAASTMDPQALESLRQAADLVALGIEQSRLHLLALRRERERAGLLRATQALLSQVELGQILTQIVTAAAEISGVEHVTVLLVDRDTGHLRPGAQAGCGTARDVPRPMGDGLSGLVVQTGESLFSPDWAHDPRNGAAGPDQARGIGTYLGLPIKRADEVLGVLTFNTQEPRTYPAEERTLLQSVADTAAIALGNARLFDAAQRELADRTRAEEALQRFQLLADQARDIALFVHPDGRILDANRAALSSYGYTREELLRLTIRDLRVPESHAAIPGQMATALREGILFETVHRRKAGRPFPVEVSSCGATLHGTPVILSLVRDISSRHAAEAALAHQAAQLDALRAVTAELTRELDLDRLLRLLIARAATLVGAASGTVYLWDPGQDRVVLGAWHGLGDFQAAREHPLGQGIAGTVAQTRHGLVANDYRGSPYANPVTLAHSAITASLGEPLVYREELVGAITLNHEGGRRFTPADQELLRLFADQAAVAIQNARLFDAVRTGRARLQRLTQQLVSVQEEERRRLSRELHDEAGQALTALKLSLELLEEALPGESAGLRQQLRDAVAVTDATAEHIRHLAHALRPPALDAVGLGAALEGCCRECAVRTRLAITYRGSAVPPLPEPVTMTLYRCLQEALTNIARHAGARQVTVRLQREGPWLRLSVADDGVGFDPQAAHAGLGLLGMRERLELAGGQLEITAQPGHGTRLVAAIPVEPSA